MVNPVDNEWLVLSPSLGEGISAKSMFRNHAERLCSISQDDDVRSRTLEDSLVEAESVEHPQHLRAALCVLTDLSRQRWSIRVNDDGVVEVQRPGGERSDPDREKARIRAQELVKRDEQLREPAVRKFIQGMERSVFHRNELVSVFSLFRDGRELADSLRRARDSPSRRWPEAIRKAVDPYLQFIEETAVCEHTGLRLYDIWRYFRHTWTNQYKSTPGRWMAFLVRDRARQFHPVMGIGAIGSPIVQIRERDTWIGWDAETFFESTLQQPVAELGGWLAKIINGAIDELFVDDFLEEPLIDRRDIQEPSPEVIDELRSYAENQRGLHHRFVRQKEHKSWPGGECDWQSRAKTHLYRSKRALALAEMLSCRRTLGMILGDRPTTASVRALTKDPEGGRAVRTILRKAKADRVGIAMADITVCGAVEPYRQILGGKLVSMLAASPEVILAYRERYGQHQSEIASSMAGRPIVRPSHLVLLGTTSLYGVGSSQYNRLRMPARLLGGRPSEHLEYLRLGKSQAYGTSQFSSVTVEALVSLVEQARNGRRVNSIFGEGVSPKLRKLRDGLSVLGLPGSALLKHGRQRIVYGVPLVRNLRGFLLGLDEEPDYLIDLTDPRKGTDAIIAWWQERWLSRRIIKDEILARLEQHVLVRPINHGARVVLPKEAATQGALFDDIDA